MKKTQELFEEYCKKGNLAEIKKILKQEKFFNNEYIDYNYSTGIFHAVDNNQLKVAQYLLEESDFKSHIKINFENNCILKTACRQSYFSIINYLVLEYQMNLTEDIFIQNYENSNYVLELYQKKLLNDKLETNMPEKKEKTKGLKI